MSIRHLRTDGRTTPLEVDSDHPRLSWTLDTLAPDALIDVSLIEARSGTTVWATRGLSADTTTVYYDGPPLPARTAYDWHVVTHDGDGAPTTYSTSFRTGMRGTWTAEWISRPRAPRFTSTGDELASPPLTELPRSWATMYNAPPLQLRRSIDLAAAPREATLYITSRGVYRATINGIRIGQDELTPGWTDYRQVIEYQAYDVTETLAAGANALAVEVADGWWSGYLGYNTRSHADQYGDRPELLAELHLTFADGSRRVIRTDGEWRENPGSRRVSDLLMGEYIDTAADTIGWMQSGYDDSGWQAVDVIERDDTTLRGQLADPVRIHTTLSPLTVTPLADGAAIVDIGQNISGRLRLRIRHAQRGDIIEIRHGERLTGEGQLYTANLRSAEARDIYVASGDAEEVFEPAFTFHGFQYAEIRGLRRPPEPSDVEAVVLSSITQRAGSLTTSHPLINRIAQNAWWSQVGNFLAVPTDCPQRDERLGWSADTQIFAPTALLSADVDAFLRRWVLELNAAQQPDGCVPDVAPVPPSSRNFDTGAPGWGDAAVLVPWSIYTASGDITFLRQQLPHMRAWVDYVRSANDGGLWTSRLGNNYGDWLSVDADTPRRVVAAAYQIRSVDTLVRALRHAGRAGEADDYEQYARHLRELFERELVDDEGRVLGDTQTGYCFALAWDLVHERRRPALAAHLARDVSSRGARLTTGFLGVALLCPTLARIGRGDLAVDLLLQEEYPSWGYSIRHGATTTWERWDGWTERTGFQTETMNSFNHYSFGSIVQWLYEGLAGITQNQDSVGYRSITISPLLDPRVEQLRAVVHSPRGEISVAWDLVEGWLEAVVPPTVEATIDLAGEVARLRPGVTRRSLAQVSTGH